MLQVHRRALLGQEREHWGTAAMREKSSSYYKELWESRLREAGVSAAHLDTVFDVLANLFRTLHSIKALSAGDQEITKKWIPQPTLKKLAHPDYFDRYFTYGVPFEDVADVVFDGALGGNDLDLASLDAPYERNALLTLRKISEHLPSDPRDCRELAAWLADKYQAKPRGTPEHVQLEGLMAKAVSPLSPDDLDLTLRPFTRTDSGLLMVEAIWHELCPSNWDDSTMGDHRRALAKELQLWLSPLLRARFETFGLESPSPLVTTSHIREINELKAAWYSLDRSGLKEFLNDQIAEGRWNYLDTIAWFVPTRSWRSKIGQFSDRDYRLLGHSVGVRG